MASLPGPSKQDVLDQISKAEGLADWLELRPDLYSFDIQVSDVQSVKPFLATGGAFHAPYVDIPLEKWDEAAKQPGIKRICSYHNFMETPIDLNAILEQMLSKSADAYKMVTTAKTALDGFRMLRLVREAASKGIKIIGHCMGEAGQFTRVLGVIMGNYLTYCTAENPIAPGQMSLEEMLRIYRIDKLNSSTKIYALIGDPVALSKGHLIHNCKFQDLGLNAVYVKIPVKKEEVDSVLSEAQACGFAGMSVTMPLKEEVGKYCRPPVQIANTLRFGDHIEGCNTDVAAALKLLEAHGNLRGKKTALIGWGGLAKSLAHALRERGAEVIVFNRTPHKEIFSLADWNRFDLKSFFIIIQATSVGMGDPNAAPVDWDRLEPHHIVMEAISNPVETALVRKAKSKGCKVITGDRFFIEQGLGQYHFWGIEHVSS